MESPDFPVIVYLLILAGIGTIGNLHVLIAYSCVFKPVSNYNIFVTIVAFFDVVGSLCVIPMEIYVLYYHKSTDNDPPCRTYSLLKSYFILGSGFMPFIITFERYLKICRFEADQVISRTTIAVCITISIIAIVVPFPSPNILWDPDKNRIKWLQCDLQNRFNQDLFPIIYYFLVTICYIVFVSSQIFMFLSIKKKLKSNELELSEEQEVVNEGSDSNPNLDNNGKCSDLLDSEPCTSETKKPGNNGKDPYHSMGLTKERKMENSGKGKVMDNVEPSIAKKLSSTGTSRDKPKPTSGQDTLVIDSASNLHVVSDSITDTLNKNTSKLVVVHNENSKSNMNTSVASSHKDNKPGLDGVKTRLTLDKTGLRTSGDCREMCLNIGDKNGIRENEHEMVLRVNNNPKITANRNGVYSNVVDNQGPSELELSVLNGQESKVGKSNPASVVDTCLDDNGNNAGLGLNFKEVPSEAENMDNREKDIKSNKEKTDQNATDCKLNSCNKEKNDSNATCDEDNHDGNADLTSCDKKKHDRNADLTSRDTQKHDGNSELTSHDLEKHGGNVLTSGDIRDKVLMFCTVPRKQRDENRSAEAKGPNKTVSSADSRIMTDKGKSSKGELQQQSTFHSSIEAWIAEGTSVCVVDCHDDEMMEHDWMTQSKREKQIKWDEKTKASFILFVGFSITFFIHILILPVLILNESFGQILDSGVTWPLIKILTRLYYLHLIINPFIYAFYDRQFRCLYCRCCLRN